jgi:predicted SAM-dependent methyltransferase
MNFLRFIFKLIKVLFNQFNYEILIVKQINNFKFNKKDINLNIGCGDYKIDNFISLDLPNNHYNKNDYTGKKFVPYDATKDKLPFKNNTVSNIYISHLIEHLETKHVFKLLKDCYRVLKKNNVLRISCPDAKFLFNVSKFKNDYWGCRYDAIKNKKTHTAEFKNLKQLDFLIRELATPKSKFYNYKIDNLILDSNRVKRLGYKTLLKKLKTNLYFRKDFPNNHINNFDYEKLYGIGKKIGFKQIIESKYLGSVSKTMQNYKFDKKTPFMSLYVDFIK